MKSIVPIALVIPATVAIAALLFVQSGDHAGTPRSLPMREVLPASSISPRDFPLSQTERHTAIAAISATATPLPAAAQTIPAGAPPAAPRLAQPSARSSSATPSAAETAPLTPATRGSAVRAPLALPGPQSASEFVVPQGAVLPAALLDPAQGASQAQADVLDRLASEFLNELTKAPPATPPPVVSSPRKKRPTTSQPDQWEAAAQQAEERYRAIFGVEAYNAWTSAAAREALAEK